MATTQLWRVTSPHFCAGLLTREGRVVGAAPILQWSVGKTRDYMRCYFARKRWSVEFVSEFQDGTEGVGYGDEKRGGGQALPRRPADAAG